MAGRVMNDSDSHGSTRRTRRWQGYTRHIAVETQKFRIFLIVSGEKKRVCQIVICGGGTVKVKVSMVLAPFSQHDL
jgi:hypothetical protein